MMLKRVIRTEDNLPGFVLGISLLGLLLLLLLPGLLMKIQGIFMVSLPRTPS